MSRFVWAVVLAVLVVACVGDSSTTTDGGGVDASTDAKPPTHCVFGSSHFGDGCKFGP